MASMVLSIKRRKLNISNTFRLMTTKTFYGVVILLTSGCLFPGGPKFFYYASSGGATDTAVVVSMPKHVEYRYKFLNSDVNEIFVLDPISSTYKKMNIDPYFDKVYSYRRRENQQNWKDVNYIIIKRTYTQSIKYDTLWKTEPGFSKKFK